MMITQTTLAITAIVAAIGIIGVVESFVIPLLQPQQAEAAGCLNGLPHSAIGVNASKTRCIH